MVLTIGSSSAQTIIFQHGFEGQPLGERPSMDVWSTSYTQGNYPANSVQVQLDATGDVFGYDSNPNQYLMVRDAAAYGFGMTNLQSLGIKVMTLSFDIIPHPNTSASARVLNVQFYGEAGVADNTQRLHASGLNTVTRLIAPSTETWGAHGEVTHFDMIMNNSLDQVGFFVGATEYFIPSGEASIWVDGSHYLTFNTARVAGTIGQNIGAFAFLTDNHATSRASYDLDNITAYNGIFVIPEPSSGALILGGLALAGAFCTRRRA
jgi:hypothetical protein